MAGRLLNRGKKGPRITPRWEPKNWEPYYDQIVLLSVYGRANVQIAEVYDLTPQQISNILNSEKGQEVKKQLAQRELELQTENIAGRFERISISAMDNIEKIMSPKVIGSVVESHPLSALRSMMDVLRATGKIKDDKKVETGNLNTNLTINQNNITVNQQTQTITAPIAIAERLNAGLDKLQQIEQIHGRAIGNGDSNRNTSK